MEYDERKKLETAVLDDQGREINNPKPHVVVPDIMRPKPLKDQIEQMTMSDRKLMRQVIAKMDRDDKEDLLEMYDTRENDLSPYEFYDKMVNDQIYGYFDLPEPKKQESETPEEKAPEPSEVPNG